MVEAVLVLPRGDAACALEPMCHTREVYTM